MDVQQRTVEVSKTSRVSCSEGITTPDKGLVILLRIFLKKSKAPNGFVMEPIPLNPLTAHVGTHN
jgi:hypothetical protein